MFKEIEGFAQKVEAKVKTAEAEVKAFFDHKKAIAIQDFKFAAERFEKDLLEDGIKLDDEFSSDLAKINAKLEAEEATLSPGPAQVGVAAS